MQKNNTTTAPILNTNRHTRTIVAIYPNQHGMGYVVCEHPNDIINYGIGKMKLLSPTNYIKRLLKFIKQYRPDIIILKDYHRDSNAIGKRVKKVIDTLELEAIKCDLKVYRYRRSEIAKVFSAFGQTNKYGISRTLAKWYPDLQRLLAPMRTFMVSEHYHMGVFDAFALMYTHASLTGLIQAKNNEN